MTNGKQSVDSERQHVIHMLQSVGIPCSKVNYLFKSCFSKLTIKLNKTTFKERYVRRANANAREILPALSTPCV